MTGADGASFGLLFENHPAAMLVIDPDTGRIVAANPAAEVFYGWSRSQLAAMRIDHINTLPRAELSERMQAASASNEYLFECQHRTATGQVREVEVCSSAVTIDQQRYLLLSIRDVSTRRRAERDLQLNAHRWQAAVDAAGGLYLEWDAQSDELLISENLKRSLGEDAGFPDSVSAWRARIHADDVGRVSVGFEALIANQRSGLQVDYRIRHRNGEWLWLRSSSRAVRAADGQLRQVVALVLDITSANKQEQQLQQAAARHAELERVINNSPAVAITWGATPGWPIHFVSGNIRQWGYDAATLMAEQASFEQIVHPDDRGRVGRELAGYIAESDDDALAQEYRIGTASGQVLWVSVATLLRRRSDRSVDCCEAVLLDISPRVASAHSLTRTNAALTAMVEAVKRIAQSPSPQAIYEAVCETLSGVGGYPLAWIGIPDPGRAGGIQTAAARGSARGFLDEIALRWSDSPEGQGVTGRALRFGATQSLAQVDPSAYPPAWDGPLRHWAVRSALSVPIRAAGDVVAALTLYSSEETAFGKRERMVIEALAEDIGDALAACSTRQRLHESESSRDQALLSLREALLASVTTLARCVEKRDPYTAGHQQRVAQIAVQIGVERGYGLDRLEGLRIGALLHDVGKIGVPAEILSKPGRLNAAELGIIRAHADIGYEVMRDMAFPWPVDRMIHEHHERLDGSGYPRGLRGDYISEDTRIVTVADVYEAMIAHRPYRPGLPAAAAVAELERGRGVLYDPAVVDAWFACLRRTDSGFGGQASP